MKYKYKLSPSLLTHDKDKINKSGLLNALEDGTWYDYLPIDNPDRKDILLKKLRMRHFHLTTKKQRENGAESNAIALFIVDSNALDEIYEFYVFHISDTHEGFTKYAGKSCTEECKLHIKMALNTLLREKETYCRNNHNMIFFNKSFFQQNTIKNNCFAMTFEDKDGEVANNSFIEFSNSLSKAEISSPFTIDAIINKIEITKYNEGVIQFIKKQIDRKRKFTSRQELLSELLKLKYTNNDIFKRAKEKQHKLLKRLDKHWIEVTDKDIIDVMNDEVTDFYNDNFNYMINPSKENEERLERHYRK